MNDPYWSFQKVRPAYKSQEPTHREHLRETLDSLVRESIQNSMDATLGADDGDGKVQPTRVVMTLGEVDTNLGGEFYGGLRPHLEACCDVLPEGELPSDGEPLRYLAIEDFNTIGLTGDPERWKSTMPDGKDNHYYLFWYGVGKSARQHKTRGSWGVGKVVFSNASRIRTFFGLTRPFNCDDVLLRGECALSQHPLPDDDDEYEWYGYFANHEERNGDDWAIPVTETSWLRRFQESYALHRQNGEAGLSIVIPYLRTEIEFDKLARAVIENYFLPILDGKLIVTLRSDDEVYELGSDSIHSVVSRMDWPKSKRPNKEQMKKLLDLGAWQVQLPADQYVELPAMGGDHPLAVSREDWPEGMLDRCSETFATHNRIALRVPVRVSRKDGEESITPVVVVLERDEDLKHSDVHHVRTGIPITELRKKSARGVRGLVLVGRDPATSTPLEELLRLSEGPAHRYWELSGEHYDKAVRTFDNTRETIRFMRKLASAIVDMLAAPQDEADRRTLRSYFPDVDEIDIDPVKKQKRKDRDGKEEADEKDIDISSSPGKQFKRIDLEDGFAIKGNPDFTGKTRPIRVSMAYACWRGNPYKRFRPADFSLRASGPLSIQTAGVDGNAEITGHNQFLFTPARPDFHVEVRGFDINRALHVDVRTVKTDTDEVDDE